LADAEKVKSLAGGGGASVGGGGLKRSDSDNDSQNAIDEGEGEKEDLARQTDEVATADITEEERTLQEANIASKVKALQIKADAINKKRDKLFKSIKAHFPTYQELQSFSCDFSNADTVELPYSNA